MTDQLLLGIFLLAILHTAQWRGGVGKCPLDIKPISASRSKLPVNVVNLPYRGLVVQKITLTYNDFRYPN